MCKKELKIFNETCEPRRVLEIFSAKWKSMVLYALHNSVLRTGELQKSLPGISKKMLFQTLRELESDNLIHRKVYNIVPLKVEYSLTAFGQTFVEPIEYLYNWGKQHAKELEELRLRRQSISTREC
ncbi:winged helix-turn-helix transcriptional regulator [Xenorhabdus bovienii]|uniref:HxlR family transcriptional regulator n=1 Tax=Xenorhabdus bovienii str. kraussei Becker Underwood TaxID=1398204 RepID=A0A077PQP0_XENBV|nr:helix-turn-helix domain-containing protein [Xenorhabdus bovienii]CDH23393.1 HxlR family transcriptional regulator [Xenorhabdus bovienii str. kraussei Becker Underwood]